MISKVEYIEVTAPLTLELSRKARGNGYKRGNNTSRELSLKAVGNGNGSGNHNESIRKNKQKNNAHGTHIR